MTATTEALGAAVTGYARAVGAALAAAGIDVTPGYILGAGDRPAVRLHTTRHRHEGLCQQVAVIEWRGELGWSAGWFENKIGGGIVHDQAWLNAGPVPPPKNLARLVSDWFAAPGTLDGVRPAAGYGQQALETLLAEYSTAQTEPTEADLADELRQLRAAMATDGLDRAGHKRAAELFLATYGDEFTEHDLAAAQVHATLAATLAAGHDDKATGALRKSVTYWEGLALNLQERLNGADDTIASQRASLKDATDQVAEADDRVAEMAAQLHQANAKLRRLETPLRTVVERDEYQARLDAVRDLCSALRSEGLTDVARRIEGVIRDADIATAKQHAAGGGLAQPAAGDAQNGADQ